MILNRRLCLAALLGATTLGLAACDKEPAGFKSTDVTGASFGARLRLTDHTGQVRELSDFKGKVVVLFFGFTQCPDVCPTSMTTLAEVKRLLGTDGDRMQALFVTVDPERDTQEVLKAYMGNFDPTFLALRPTPDELQGVAQEFKMYYRKVEGPTPTSYTMDHSAGKYLFDPEGRIRLFSAYGTAADVIAQDTRLLLSGH